MSQLSAQLRADGTAAAGNHNHFAPVVGIGLFVGNTDRLSEQQLLNVKFPHLTLTAGRLHGREIIHLNFIACPGISGKQFPLFLIRNAGDCHNNFLHLILAQLLHGICPF